ncbi:MAG: methyltransferase domain-containing protein [Gemmatimonas sp.]|nr:methyltransferase domain-containing protein [Gemmatimonas sp.]
MADEFWEQADVVEQFAAREPDHRLLKLIDACESPGSTRVLDLGCAGGRNAVFLAEHGLDVWALDASAAMVARTRERLRPVLGDEAAQRRVHHGRMDDLGVYADATFSLVVALGILHNARSRAEWERTISEVNRVLATEGRLLMQHFTPEVDMTGEGVRPTADDPDVYDGFPGGRVILFEREALDAAMKRYGFRTEVPSETVRVEAPPGRRVSTNALYRKEKPAPQRPSRGEREGAGVPPHASA